jgi:microcystin degradation protein MlrC
MVAHGYDDCEGDIIARVRAIVGPGVVIGVEHDPHCHLTANRLENCDLLICFKEFPHTDSVARAEEVVELTLRTIRGEIKPVMSTFDCRMICGFPTTRQPMRSFVDEISAMEGKEGVLSISIAHGFSFADVPDVGTRVLVVTDDRKDVGDALAERLGRRLQAMREQTQPPFLSVDAAIDRALEVGGPVVVADVTDNPGGGAAGDNTTFLRRLIERGISGAALAPIWDPVAVSLCHAAGEGARLPLRFGGKTAATSGQPIDALVTVTKLVRAATTTRFDGTAPLGDAAAIDVNGIAVVLITKRTQAFHPDLFTNLGIDPTKRNPVVVKSTNHFHAAFAPIASEVLYADGDGPLPRDPTCNPYTRIKRPIWPLDPLPA